MTLAEALHVPPALVYALAKTHEEVSGSPGCCWGAPDRASQHSETSYASGRRFDCIGQSERARRGPSFHHCPPVMSAQVVALLETSAKARQLGDLRALREAQSPASDLGELEAVSSQALASYDPALALAGSHLAAAGAALRKTRALLQRQTGECCAALARLGAALAGHAERNAAAAGRLAGQPTSLELAVEVQLLSRVQGELAVRARRAAASFGAAALPPFAGALALLKAEAVEALAQVAAGHGPAGGQPAGQPPAASPQQQQQQQATQQPPPAPPQQQEQEQPSPVNTAAAVAAPPAAAPPLPLTQPAPISPVAMAALLSTFQLMGSQLQQVMAGQPQYQSQAAQLQQQYLQPAQQAAQQRPRLGGEGGTLGAFGAPSGPRMAAAELAQGPAAPLLGPRPPVGQEQQQQQQQQEEGAAGASPRTHTQLLSPLPDLAPPLLAASAQALPPPLHQGGTPRLDACVQTEGPTASQQAGSLLALRCAGFCMVEIASVSV